MKLSAWLCTVAPLLIACSESSGEGSDNPSNADISIAEGTLSGKVGGKPWSLVTAQTDAFLSADDPEFWIDFYAEAVTACTMPMGVSQNHIILHVPKTPGDYRLSLSLNGTFVIDGETTDNLVATKGRILVDQVSDASVRGGFTMQYDQNNSVSGHFEAKICAE
ncbi:MAG TPA: hypothetical protein VIV60_23575 [Polyangiaceae bacterium]